MLLPAVALLIVTRLAPVGQAIISSLTDPETEGIFGVYAALWESETFRESLKVTLWFNLIINPFQVIAALVLAVLLTQNLPAVGLARTVIFLPAAIPQAVSTVVWGIAFRPADGIANSFLQVFGISPQPFLTSPQQALYSIMVIASWIGVGYWMMFLIAGLREIPQSLLEAASLDGAGWWRQFFAIKLPLLKRSLSFVLVAATVANFLLFVPVQVLTDGGPAGSTNLLMHEIYRQALTFHDMPYASAQVVVLTSITLVIVAIQFRLLRPST
ncbi:MAG TPA: sugar ABC transporter permease [Beutenbergiaceae bacterium]|nr:sugar ABC transporter permease [Beutenbergiaceae bacterium]